jgi:DNA invertase Pin-like site-specific DNA recombinase
MRRLFLYGRVSTDDQATSAEAQAVRLREFAAHSGLALGGVFIDEDVSGARPLQERPRGKQMCDLVGQGDSIAFTKVDRCFRSLADAAAMLQKWKSIGVGVQILDLGIDVNTPAGELFFSQLAAFAQFERAMIGQRILEAMGHLKRQGRPYSSTRPLGWIRDGEAWEPCQTERMLGGRVLALRASGMTWAGIARTFALEGVAKPGKAKQARAGRGRGVWYLESDIRRLFKAASAGFPCVAATAVR